MAFREPDKQISTRNEGEVVVCPAAENQPCPVGSSRWKEEVEGPFRRVDNNPDSCEIARLAICVLTLVPIRLVILLVVLISYYIFATCWLALVPDREWAKRIVIWLTRRSSRFILLVMGFWHIEVTGRENAGQEREPRVFVSNHVSYVEILFFLSELGASFVMKRTCLQVPFIGSIATRILNSVSVDNKGGKEGGSGFDAIAERIDAMFNRATSETLAATAANNSETEPRSADSSHQRWLSRGGLPLLIFPEGTTSNGSCLLRFRTGIFAARGTPVHPVVVRFPFRRFSPAFESILAPTHVLRLLSEPSNTLRVKFLPRHDPSPEEIADPRRYAEVVRESMSRALGGLPKVNAGYGDKTKYHKYMRQKYREHPWGLLALLLVVAPDKMPEEGVEDRSTGYGTRYGSLAGTETGQAGALSNRNSSNDYGNSSEEVDIVQSGDLRKRVT
ncbi:unnamed protein product [Discosporangium mesarthrocarpum]